MKRFYETVTIAERDGGFVVQLDGRDLKTPEKKPVILPTRALAEAIREEWDSQQDKIDPSRMPMTRMTNTTLDRVESRRDEIIEELVRFGGSDQLCYRASFPQDLVKRQDSTWRPLLDWLKDHYDVHLKVTSGIVHMAQDDRELAKLRRILKKLDSYEMAALHNMTTLTGSLTVGLNLHAGAISEDNAWKAGHLDENFQVEQWGEDDDAEQRRQAMRKELGDSARFLSLMR